MNKEKLSETKKDACDKRSFLFIYIVSKYQIKESNKEKWK